jgi:RNA polymerase sigma-70 factor (ECF subfamily)
VYLGAERRSERGRGGGLELPAFATGYAEQLGFLELSEPSDLTAADERGLRLIARFQSGEAAAFDEFYARHFAPVYSYLSGALRDPHEAEDLSQETWVRVERALGRFEIRPGVPFRRWLFRIAQRVLIDELRRRARVPLEASIEALADEPVMSVEESFGERWFARRELHEAIDRLPPAGRQAVLLRYFVGLGYPEIAALTGRSQDAVRQLNSRMLRQLGKRLDSVEVRATRGERRWMRTRLRRLPVLGERRWCLDGTARISRSAPMSTYSIPLGATRPPPQALRPTPIFSSTVTSSNFCRSRY